MPCRAKSISHILVANFVDNQPTINYALKHIVFAGWCSSKSVGVKKLDRKCVCFVYAKQQLPELTVLNHWRGHRQFMIFA